MLKIVCILALIQIFSQQVNGICEYFSQRACIQDSQCFWYANPTCLDQIDCSLLQQNDCQRSSQCLYNPPLNEMCIQKQFSCFSLDKESCQAKSDRCSLKVNKKCMQKKNYTFPNCYQMDQQQCLQQSNFCEVTGSCQENDIICEASDRKSCKQKGQQCQFQTFQKAKCTVKPEYCLSKSEKECKETNNCKLISEESTCRNKQSCQVLDKSDCKQQSQYCTLVENLSAECVSKGLPCFKIQDKSQCENELNCQYDDNTNTCWFQKECHFLNSFNCLKYQAECKYTPPKQYACLNKQICNQLSDKQCEQNQNYCHYTPPQKICNTDQDLCKNLELDECENYKFCRIQEEIGFCYFNKDFECRDVEIEKCANLQECAIDKFQCQQKPQLRCEQLDNEECISYDHCYLKEEYSCLDFLVTCPVNKISCIQNPFCEWQLFKPYSCQNLVKCSLLTEDCPFDQGCRLIDQGCGYKFLNS